MTGFRAIVTFVVISGACFFGAISNASAQPGSQGFSLCPQTPVQYSAVMKQLVSDAARARATGAPESAAPDYAAPDSGTTEIHPPDTHPGRPRSSRGATIRGALKRPLANSASHLDN